MAITAAMVKELRERTGAGMMECKKALSAASGDIEVAIEEMRKSGAAKAVKKAGRVAAEGVIIIKASTDNKTVAVTEVNCETDFVARDASFLAFANEVGELVLANSLTDVAAVAEAMGADGQTVEEKRTALIAKIGENISVRRAQIIESQGVIGAYTHGGRIGVAVELEDGDAELAKQVAMHVAASNPMVVNPEDMPAEIVEKEKEIIKAQPDMAGKPDNIIEKMMGGRINKFLAENALVGQPFVIDPNVKVGQYLQERGTKVLGFIRFEVGEGIEKKEDDFAAEVMKTVQGG
ncbi:elongation factor Ts [Piscirickettsia salmonis]|uniref:Elongation factor Ts n=1 Tax=Piscirickettsia salmonis TaxID=1238 RepID=A0A9Q5VDT4_PISSA|nr:translation elongation factor Ts [Piscirickettsia salmonis]RNC78277.1 elongation factor Ts [Piscirickettsiaceae bacterium NZ-RLO2]ALA24210.1 elongation factor Ts [Piscirickettsia salmonis]APS44600.1 elongation factor Ts [Piscirickettsia salmonis]APS47962.1 elongation factor Ts [Piscirickettsia salmonis]APS51917.1 elongation factor Ts [Piscirickettsia salmonis]